MAIDSHMHINSVTKDIYGADIDESISMVNNNSMLSKVINVGLDIPTSIECINISKTNPKFYNSIGIHPLYVENQNIDELYNMVSEKTVAIGEIGIDLTKSNIREQKRYLITQIILANRLGLPVIIHANNANKEVIKIFEEYVRPEYGCVFHCFQPDIDDLNYLVNHGYYISFAGRITYKTAKKSIEVLKEVPEKLFLVETDSPFISPEPVKEEVGVSSNICYIINRIGEIKNLSPRYIERITEENTRRLFKRIK